MIKTITNSSNKITPEQFVYWLQGFFEMSNPDFVNPKQTEMIKEHLKLVFTKVTPTTLTTNLGTPLVVPSQPWVPGPLGTEVTCTSGLTIQGSSLEELQVQMVKDSSTSPCIC